MIVSEYRKQQTARKGPVNLQDILFPSHVRIVIKHGHCMSMQFSLVNLSTHETFYNVVTYLFFLELQTSAMAT